MERAVDRLFVTGTDTGVGKTVVSAALLHAFRAHGRRAVGMKPVASGCERAPEGWRNEDALALQAASDPRNPVGEGKVVVSPWPSRRIRIPATLRRSCRGIGGWAAPLTATLDQRHLVQELRLPVVLVVGMRLGCINHARLSARAIQEDGARLVGWIANEVDPAMARRDENFALLSARMPVPCWGRLPHAPDIDAGQLSRHIAIPL